MTAQLFLFMHANMQIYFLFFLAAIAINGKKESDFGQSRARKKKSNRLKEVNLVGMKQH